MMTTKVTVFLFESAFTSQASALHRFLHLAVYGNVVTEMGVALSPPTSPLGSAVAGTTRAVGGDRDRGGNASSGSSGRNGGGSGTHRATAADHNSKHGNCGEGSSIRSSSNRSNDSHTHGPGDDGGGDDADDGQHEDEDGEDSHDEGAELGLVIPVRNAASLRPRHASKHREAGLSPSRYSVQMQDLMAGLASPVDGLLDPQLGACVPR
jgi:hypothetical protein